jgi:hypothetical protein
VSGLRAQLTAIYEQHGELTPERVVEAARLESHPLHHRFDWDDRVAGDSWRRHQAAELIRSVRIRYTRPDGMWPPVGEVRAFLGVRDGSGPARYEPAQQVANDPALRELALRDMKRDWDNMVARYEAFEEFSDLVAGWMAARQ